MDIALRHLGIDITKKFCYGFGMHLLLKHNRLIRGIILVIPLFLAVVGMRVPDFSRPHKPKPMRRAVLENASSRTIVQSIVKADIAPVIPEQPVNVTPDPAISSIEVVTTYSPVSLLSLNPLPPRAPPA